MRIALIVATIVVGVLAFLANFTPWWFYPGVAHWELSTNPWPPTSCVLAGDTLRLTARRTVGGAFGGSLDYSSSMYMARTLGRFQWNVLPPTDSFWVSKRGTQLGDEPRGIGTVDRNGVFTGVSEGNVAVEVREGDKRSITRLVVFPTLTFEVVPAEPSVQPGKYVDVEIRATFPDGTSPPSSPRPRLSPDSSHSAARVVNQIVSSRGRPFAPWNALLHATKPGPHLLTLTYLTRRMPVRVVSDGAPSPEASEALVDSVKRALFPMSDHTAWASLPEPLRWRMSRIGQCVW